MTFISCIPHPITSNFEVESRRAWVDSVIPGQLYVGSVFH